MHVNMDQEMFYLSRIRTLLARAIASAAALAPVPALAELPANWQMHFQTAASPIMEEINNFHNLLLPVIFLIVLFVTFLLINVMVRYNARANSKPATFTHHTYLELTWTVIPIFILLVIAVPSMRLLYAEDVVPEAGMTLKLTGNQWYWTVEYPDQSSITYDMVMLEDSERPADAPRLLAVDNELVVPVDTVIRVIVTASDVIHAFAMPAMGVKIDAVPGRLNETWFKATREGTFYGQCSELCGSRHAFMPLALKVVSRPAFESWIEEAKTKYASRPTSRAIAQVVN